MGDYSAEQELRSERLGRTYAKPAQAATVAVYRPAGVRDCLLHVTYAGDWLSQTGLLWSNCQVGQTMGTGEDTKGKGSGPVRDIEQIGVTVGRENPRASWASKLVSQDFIAHYGLFS